MSAMEDRSGALARRKRRTRRRWRARRGNNARRKKPDSDPVEMMHSVCRSLLCAARAGTGDRAGLRCYTRGDDSAGTSKGSIAPRQTAQARLEGINDVPFALKAGAGTGLRAGGGSSRVGVESSVSSTPPPAGVHVRRGTATVDGEGEEGERLRAGPIESRTKMMGGRWVALAS